MDTHNISKEIVDKAILECSDSDYKYAGACGRLEGTISTLLWHLEYRCPGEFERIVKEIQR